MNRNNAEAVGLVAAVLMAGAVTLAVAGALRGPEPGGAPVPTFGPNTGAIPTVTPTPFRTQGASSATPPPTPAEPVVQPTPQIIEVPGPTVEVPVVPPVCAEAVLTLQTIALESEAFITAILDADVLDLPAIIAANTDLRGVLATYPEAQIAACLAIWEDNP